MQKVLNVDVAAMDLSVVQKMELQVDVAKEHAVGVVKYVLAQEY